MRRVWAEICYPYGAMTHRLVIFSHLRGVRVPESVAPLTDRLWRSAQYLHVSAVAECSYGDCRWKGFGASVQIRVSRFEGSRLAVEIMTLIFWSGTHFLGRSLFVAQVLLLLEVF